MSFTPSVKLLLILFLAAVDAFGNRAFRGGELFSAFVSADGAILTNCEVIDCEDGTYLGLYIAPASAPSSCLLDICLGHTKAPVLGSPLRITVDSAISR